MSDREQIQAGGNFIDAEMDFADGVSEGYLYYYDRNYQLPRPFTSESLQGFLVKHMHDERETNAFNMGFVTGWLKAFFENDTNGFYTSIVLTEAVQETESLPVVVLQNA